MCACLKLIRVYTRVGVSQEEYKGKGVYTVGVSQEGYKGVHTSCRCVSGRLNKVV